MKKGFVVSAVLYPLLVIALALIMGVISMSDNRRKILDNMKLEVSEESESDPEMSNSTLYYKMKALEEAYGELNARFSEEYFDQIKADYEKKIADAKAQAISSANTTINNTKTDLTNSINSAKSSAISTAKLQAFPVGSIFVSTTSTNPSSYIGGTWAAYGQGRTLIGTGSGTDSNSTSKSFTLGATGGEYNHKLTTSEMPTHAHNNTAVSSTISGKFGATTPYFHAKYVTGAFSVSDFGRTEDAVAGDRVTDVVYGYSFSATPTITLNNANTGGNQVHNNLQPYITVYFWKRTA